MRMMRMVVGALMGLVLLTSGLLAARSAAPATPRAGGLPSWSPKHPSKEFLRAAKTLRPVPPEAQEYEPIYVPAWELFGSLTDKQVKQFLTRQQVSRPLASLEPGFRKFAEESEEGRRVGDKLVWYLRYVQVEMKAFSPRQRAIFDALTEAWRTQHRGTPDEDLLVLLYKSGAKKDLSNVVVDFRTLGGHGVYLSLMAVIPEAGGRARSVGLHTDCWIAQI